MRCYYLFLSSLPNEYYKNNNFFDFTVVFPQNIDLTGSDWEIGLCEISFSEAIENCPNMYMCTDIITGSFVNGKTLPVLRYLPDMQRENFKIFDCVYYFD